MRKSKVLAKIRAGKVARICVNGDYLPHLPMHAAQAGYDGIWVDAEHRAFDPRQIQAFLAFHHLADIDCIWRASTLEKTGLYRLLEDGAAGLMIPHVSTPDLAKKLVQTVKFPPLGDRGFDGAGLDTRFVTAYNEQYASDANRETFLVVQIETPQAVENVEEIAAVPGVEILFVGYGDLSLRLQCSAEVEEPKLLKIFDKVACAAKRHGKAWGCPVSNIDEVKRIQGMGAQLIAYGNTYMAIYSHLHGAGAEMDAAFGEQTGPADSGNTNVA
jgi:4-hydroxy-2-oxoheptanedioate aldolase